MMRYAKPKSLDEALALLSEGRWRIIAGGTDFYPAQGVRPLTDDVLDVNGLSGLRGIAETEEHIVIGARTTWTAILRHDLPPAFASLKLAAREVGSIQIQNTGTVAGNLCNASPAADGVPPLLTLDASVELRSVAGRRVLPLREFILGNRRTALQAGELLTAVLVPKTSATGVSHFIKLGARRYLVISIAMVAARLVLEGDRIAEAAIAVGACSAVAARLDGLERSLRGARVEMAAGLIQAYAFPELAPIDDVRATSTYRRDAAREIVARAVGGALDAAIVAGRSAAA
jgi:CO/xanthine dehydrogenase FAD-binding subunit